MSRREACVFTIVQNEPTWLPVWLSYYHKHFDQQDIFVLDHDSTDPRTLESMMGTCNRVPVHRELSFDHHWLRDTLKSFQAFLLQSYQTVLAAEVDEIVAADPEAYPGGLGQLIREHPWPQDYLRCTGYDIIHAFGREPDLDLSKPVMSQRQMMRPSEIYSKPLLARATKPWDPGFHRFEPPEQFPLVAPEPHLMLLHLHRADYRLAWAKTQENARRKWSQWDKSMNWGYQNAFQDEKEFAHWFFNDFFDKKIVSFVPIPDHWKEIV